MSLNPNISTALNLLASKFESEGSPLQALHCLHALLQSRLLPDQEAKARVQAGRLMLEHTTNHKEAYKELMAALQAASSLVGSFCLKCEVFCWLGRYHQLQGQTNHQLQAFQQGLQVCEAALGTTERLPLLRWGAYFHAKLVSALWDSGEGLTKTRSAANQGADYAKQHALLDVELVFELLHLQLDLVEAQARGILGAPPCPMPPTPTTAEGLPAQLDGSFKLRFMAIDELMARLRYQDGQASVSLPAAVAGPQGLGGLLSYAALQTSLLQVLYELGRGRLDKLIAPADQSGRRNPLVTVEQMRMLLEDCRSSPAGYSWLSLSEAEASISLCGVMLCSYYGKLDQAHEQLKLGKAAVQQWLEELHVAGSGVSERSMDCLGLWLSRTPLVLRLQLSVCEAHLHFTSTELSKARDAVKEVLAQVRLFPNQLRSMVAPAHLLAGQYAHAAEEWDAAIAHFQAAQQAYHAPTRLLASSFLALTLCCKSDKSLNDTENAQAAVDALGDAYVELTSAPLGSFKAKGEPLELVMAQVAAAVIKFRMGQHQEAHQRLSLVLRAAHVHLMHHSLLSTCMSYLVPLQFELGDLAAADSMVASAHLLASGSLRTMCHLHRLLTAVSTAMPHGQDRAAKAQSDYEADAALLSAKVMDTRTSDAPGHAYALNFGLKQ